MVETLPIHHGCLVGAHHRRHPVRWRWTAAAAGTLPLRTLTAFISTRRLRWLGGQRQGRALPLSLKECSEKARWINRRLVLYYLNYWRSQATAARESHPGSCTACRESWEIHHHRQPMPLSLPVVIRPIGQPQRSTPRVSTPGDGGWTHPRRDDIMALEENIWSTTSFSVISPSTEKSMTRYSLA
jgi:hypothetical protein